MEEQERPVSLVGKTWGEKNLEELGMDGKEILQCILTLRW
jgi:hypothetical protein